MYLNNFSVRIPEGQELAGGYVEMEHGQQYRLVVRNSQSDRCDARIEVDGKHVGTWRIERHRSITLERPAHDAGRFTFYRVGTVEARQAGLAEGDPNLGLVRVVFTPERRREPAVVPDYLVDPFVTSSLRPRRYDRFHGVRELTESAGEGVASASGYSAGGTGLSGHSQQWFGQADEIEYDYSRQTVVHLRLVARGNTATVRSLTSFSTPVPPAVG